MEVGRVWISQAQRRPWRRESGIALDQQRPRRPIPTELPLDDRFRESCRNEGIHLVFLTPI
jgi:hypothetical protein